MDPAPARSYLTLGEAVKAVEVSRSTLQRRLKAGEIEGAHRTNEGTYAIPYAGLIAAGLAPRSTPADQAPEVDYQIEIERLRTENAHLRQLADERAHYLRVLEENLSRVTAALPSGPSMLPASVEPSDIAAETATPASRPRWFRRR
jgi:hypothetical protein